MSTIEVRGEKFEVNTHAMSNFPFDAQGNPLIEFDENYEQPIDPYRRTALLLNLETLYPGKDVSIIGAPWDYTLAEPQDLHEDTVIGHYRVQIDGQDYIACVDEFDHPTALSLGAEIFDEYKKAGIDVSGVQAFPDGTISKLIAHNNTNYALHLEEFRPGARTLANPEVRLNGRQEQLGTMIGKIHNAYGNSDGALGYNWREFSRNTSIKAVKEGLDIFNQGEGIQVLKELVQQGAGADLDGQALNEMFGEIVQIAETEIPDLLDHGTYVGTSFNAIDKMVIDNDTPFISKLRNFTYEKLGLKLPGFLTKDFGFKSHDTVARGFVPMMSDNAAHDMAFALSRIAAKPALYDGDNKDGEIDQGMKDAIEGYNEATGLKLTFDEAVTAMKTQAVFQTLFGLGYNKLAAGHEATTEDLAKHIVTQILPQFQNINALA